MHNWAPWALFSGAFMSILQELGASEEREWVGSMIEMGRSSWVLVRFEGYERERERERGKQGVERL